MANTHAHLQGRNVSLILNIAPLQTPHIVYWGPRIDADTDVTSLGVLHAHGGVDGGPDSDLPTSLAMESGLGLFVPPALKAHRNGQDSGQLFLTQSAEHDGRCVRIICHDAARDMALEHFITLDHETGILCASSKLVNEGTDILHVDALASICLPISARMRDIIGFHGRWGNELQMQRFARPPGSWLSENLSGRTSHSHFPGVILCEADANDDMGHAYAVHIGWSGNHYLRIDSLPDARVQLSGGARLLSGEVILAPGESYETPTLYAGFSDQGLNLLSQNFARFVRSTILPQRFADRPRPVHYNCWEAVYFNHDIRKLKSLASKAAQLGAERFILDDGWFGARRNDRAGLGDWQVSKAVYPDGLHPLIDHIQSLNMEMGLWFEPEMVNPDSDLYRAHPDWVLSAKDIEPIAFRGQYVLDISRKEVSDYLFQSIDAILRAYAISYIKWDMNRDISHPYNQAGNVVATAYVDALYALIDRVRAAHPDVEVESCSSGGGRIDYGILQRTDRLWVSDSNDALDRQIIQRGASHWLPLRISGAHVGPHICKITHRAVPMAMRCASAIFGHMGLELDLLNESPEDLAELARAIALHKRHRLLLHSGDIFRLAPRDDGNDMMVVAADKKSALLSTAQLQTAKTTLAGPLCLRGLRAEQLYRLSLVWPDGVEDRHIRAFADRLIAIGDKGISGAALMQNGLQLPQTQPAHALIIYIEAV